jgi:hypothetical protein
MSDTAVPQPQQQPQPLPPKIADQSYVIYEGDLARLESIEKLIAKYANGLARKLGQYETIPDTNTGAGQDQPGFFRHGIVSASKEYWKAKGGEGPQWADEFTLKFPPTPAQATVEVIESSEELILVRGERGPRVIDVSSGSHLIVFGNVVCIKGKISIPGKHIVIFARELRTLAKGNEGAELNVDGKAPEPSALQPADRGTDGTEGTDAKCTLNFWEQPVVTPAGNGHQGGTGKDGLPGNNGSCGGAIYIVCDTLQRTSKLSLSAAGGNGQGGQNGQKGGNGGPGGKGAKYDGNLAHYMVRSGYGGPGGWGGRGGLGGAGGDSGDCVAIFNKPISSEDPSGNAIKAGNQPGDTGARGQEGAFGDDGPRGQEPSYDAATFTVYDAKAAGVRDKLVRPDLLRPPHARWGRSLIVHDVQALVEGKVDNHPFNNLCGLAKISHLQMVMETVRARYLEWDACRVAKSSRETKAKEELLELLDFLELGRRLLAYGTQIEQVARDQISAALARWPMQMAHRLDYFGNPDNFVPSPLGPPGIHLNALKEGLQSLETWELRYAQYRAALLEHSHTRTQRGKAIAAVNEWMTKLKNDYDKRRLDLIGKIQEITDARKKVTLTQGKLGAALQDMKTWVDTCFGLTPEDFIDCVFNLAFCGSPVGEGGTGGTQISKHGLFTIGTTLTSQTAKLIAKGFETLPNDEGIPVSRKHLITRMDMFSKRLTNLREAFQMVKSGVNSPEIAVLEDKDAYRLVVVQQEFDALLDQFSTKPQAQAAMAAMDNYVDAIQERNAVLDQYNAMVLDYLRIAADTHTATSQLKTIEDLNEADANPDLPSETAFICALYNRMRERCIEDYYRASRSYSFWALKADDSLLTTLQLGKINQIDCYLLQGTAQELIFKNRMSEIRASPVPKRNPPGANQTEKPPFYFPPLADEHEGAGIYFPLQGGYALSLVSIHGIEEIPNEGCQDVFVARVGENLHIRIFDGKGKKIVDKTEAELSQSKSLTIFKEKITIECDYEKMEEDVRQNLDQIGQEVGKLTGHPARLQYRLLLMSDDSLLPAAGRNLVIVAVTSAGPATHFRVRVFNDAATLVFDETIHDQETAEGRKAVWSLLQKTLLPQPFPAVHPNKIAGMAAPLVRQADGPSNATMIVCSSVDDIPKKARDKVIVSFVGTKIHIDIFNPMGSHIIQKAEGEPMRYGSVMIPDEPGEDFTEFKQILRSVLSAFLLTPQAQRRFLEELALHLDLPLGRSLSIQVSSRAKPKDEGHNSVNLALVGETLLIRIFDEHGTKLVEVADDRWKEKSTFLQSFLSPYSDRLAFYESLTSRFEDELIITASTLAGHPVVPGGYRKELAQLRETGKATFSIPPPAEGDNELALYCNVRLKRVRPWVDGIDSGFVALKIKHKGPELIRAHDNSLIPFLHAEVEGRFKYEAAPDMWSANKEYVKMPVMALKRGIDGDFPTVSLAGDTHTYLRNIGPFTDWEFTVEGGDRSQIKAIYLEFQGIAQNPD